MSIFKSDALEMKRQLMKLKQAVNAARKSQGLTAITNDHLILELVGAAFDNATKSSGSGVYLANVFVRVQGE